MRGSSFILVSAAAALCLASAASAATLDWEGTLDLNWGSLWGSLPSVVATGTGVATVNGSGGLGHLNTLGVAGGITMATEEAIPVTDPTAPELASLRGTMNLGTGTVKPISGGGPLTANTIPIPGAFKLCLLFAGCNAWLDLPLTEDGTRGVGIGGVLLVNAFGAGIRLSIQGAPWTVATAMITGVFTTNAMVPGDAHATENSTFTGFAHGPASASSTANISGVLQLVSAGTVLANLDPPSNYQALPSTLRLHFVPEPGLLLLLASGVAGLALVGRMRMRR